MKPRTRVKICGITRIQDALHAAEMGVDALGLVFHRSSPRAISIAQGLAIREQIPPFVTLTALFMDETEDWVSQVVQQLRPDCLQFHGNESSAFCDSWAIPYLKAIPMGDTRNAKGYASNYPTAQGFLLDSNLAGRQGGSGDTFDWSTIPVGFEFPLLLAGGIRPSNVAAAIKQVRPWGVDVSSGVESSKGVKDSALIDQLMQQVRRGDGDDDISADDGGTDQAGS